MIFKHICGSKGKNRTSDFAVNNHIQEKYTDRRIREERSGEGRIRE